MENQLQIFNNPEFGTVRTLGDWENPLFCLPDVCRALELDASQVMKRLEDEVVSIHPIPDSLGRIQMTNFVNEDGLYDVILDSRKPEARKFRKWITSEVLPAIRKYGYYALPSIEMLLKQIAKESAKNDEELACLAAQMPVLSLQMRAMIKKLLAEYEKERKNPVPVILDLPSEKWEWIKGYEGVYQVSTEGRARSFFRGKCRLLKPTPGPRGYLTICLYHFDEKDQKLHKKTFRLNRIVAETFIPNPLNLPEVHHKDDNKANNAVWNLEWVTGEQNRKYAHKSGLYLKGEKNPSAKLTEDDVRFIRKNHKPGDPEFGTRALSKRFNVSDTNIRNIVNFKIWQNVQ